MKYAILALSVVLAFGIGFYVRPEVKAPGMATVITAKGQKITLGPNDSLRYKIKYKKDIGPTTNNFNGLATAKGPQLDAIAYGGILGKSLMSFQTQPAEVSMGGSMGTVPAMAYKASLSVNNGPLLILVVGCLCLIGGIVCWIKRWGGKLGIALVIGGAALIVIALTFASFPWVGLLLIPIGIGAVVYLWWRAKKGEDKSTALKTIVGAVDNLDEEEKQKVTSKISEEAKISGKGANGVKPVVSKVVAEVKKEVI